MAGTRIHRLGTIFSRANGLLRSGALQDEDKPLWYDVYEAFPPQLEPKYERSVSQKEVVNILYPEDLIRAKFYKIYGNPDVVDLTNKGVDTTCQKFVKKYFQQQKLGVPRDQLFDTVVNLLKQEGIRLRTLEDVQQDKLKINVRSHLPGAKEVFGDKITKQREEDDFIEEER